MVFCLRSQRRAKSSDYRVSPSRTSLQREIKAGALPRDIPRGLNIGNEALEPRRQLGRTYQNSQIRAVGTLRIPTLPLTRHPLCGLQTRGEDSQRIFRNFSPRCRTTSLSLSLSFAANFSFSFITPIPVLSLSLLLVR